MPRGQPLAYWGRDGGSTKWRCPAALGKLACPQAHWCTIRTTNAIERAFREVRRRTRPMSCFNNRASVDRIICRVLSYINNKWKDKPLRQFTQNS